MWRQIYRAINWHPHILRLGYIGPFWLRPMAVSGVSLPGIVALFLLLFTSWHFLTFPHREDKCRTIHFLTFTFPLLPVIDVPVFFYTLSHWELHLPPLPPLIPFAYQPSILYPTSLTSLPSMMEQIQRRIDITLFNDLWWYNMIYLKFNLLYQTLSIPIIMKYVFIVFIGSSISCSGYIVGGIGGQEVACSTLAHCTFGKSQVVVDFLI